MLPTKMSVRFMNFQKLFYFLVCLICILTYYSCTGNPSLHVQFCPYVFQGKMPPALKDSVRHLTCIWRPFSFYKSCNGAALYFNSLLLCVGEHYSYKNSKFCSVSQTLTNCLCLLLAEQVCNPCN